MRGLKRDMKSLKNKFDNWIGGGIQIISKNYYIILKSFRFNVIRFARLSIISLV